MICWKCGHQNSEHDKFCSACGASLQMKNKESVQDISQENQVMVCWKCGHLNSTDNEFCSKCGANLRNADQPSSEQTEIKPQPVRAEKSSQTEQKEKKQADNESVSEQKVKDEGGILTVISLIFAVLYLIKIIMTIPIIWGIIGDISLKIYGFLPIGDLLIVLLTIFSFAAFAFILFLFAMRHTKENEEIMYLGIVSAAVLRLAVATINMIWNAIFNSVLRIKRLISNGVFLPWFLTFLFIIFVVGVLFIIFLMVGKKPLLGKSLNELKLLLKEVPNTFQKEASQLSFSSKGFQKETKQPSFNSEGFQKETGQSSFRSEDFQKETKQLSFSSEGDSGNKENPPNFSGPVFSSQLETNRSLFKYIIFTILTCGIYAIIFYHDMIKDMNTICQGDGEHTDGLVKMFIFTILTCGIYMYIWYYQFEDRMVNNAPRYGITITETGTTVLLWMILGVFCCGIGPFVGLHIMIKNLNQLAKAYNEKCSQQAAANNAGYPQ